MGYAGGMRSIVGYTAASVAKGAEYLRAEASLITHGPLPPDEVELRIASCRVCPKFVATEDERVGFCRACGCGDWTRSALATKATMPAARCPLRRWPEAAQDRVD